MRRCDSSAGVREKVSLFAGLGVTNPRKRARKSRARLLASSDGAQKVRQQAVGSGFDAGIVLDDGEAENGEVKAERGAGAFEIGERIAGQKEFRANRAFDAGAAAFGAADQFIAHACGARV